MTGRSLQLSANLSFLFTDVPFVERFGRAARDGVSRRCRAGDRLRAPARLHATQLPGWRSARRRSAEGDPGDLRGQPAPRCKAPGHARHPPAGRADQQSCDIPGFWLDTPAKACALLAELAEANLWLQYDIYHAQVMEGDLARTITANIGRIAHLQLADNPGRHEPGSGEINYPFLLALLDRLGYTGWIGCEYRPLLPDTDSGLAWAKDLLGG